MFTLALPVHPGARAYVLPCIAGHVGADTAGVILSEGPHLTDEVNLIVYPLFLGAGVRFLFRAFVPATGNWAFAPATSRPVAVTG